MDTNDDQGGLRFSAGAPPTGNYETPAATTPARRGIAPAIVAAVAIIGLGVGFGAGYAAHGSNKPSQPAAAAATSAATTVTVQGSLTLKHSWLSATATLGETCTASDGYSDISAGTAVTIGDQTGATIVVGQLQPGQVTADGCEFDFNMQAPAGRTSYTVTVSHRGTQVFTPDQIAQANMTLG